MIFFTLSSSLLLFSLSSRILFFVFFFSATSPTEIYTLSLHDALPISAGSRYCHRRLPPAADQTPSSTSRAIGDRKSTRLNSSHVAISYAVFCLKKKND